MRNRNYRRNNGSVAIGAFVLVYAVIAFLVWLIVVGALVAIAGDVIGLWEAVSFV